EDEANIVLYPVCWDVTTSYGDGTARGPQAMIEASVQLDFFDPVVLEGWSYKHGTRQPDPLQLAQSDALRAQAREIIEKLEKGVSERDASLRPLYKAVNAGCKSMIDRVYFECS
ncbi:arginase family protein, partial [Arthrospira platensis SPKY1]|nr:arginase family protein [Arthrospira platensis SPKY1]